ncbi:hypothetical protein TRVL_09873 [Trypanosoma vivax]|nr:hypothetical protein TRVL_09873 [Trypanosoma vivax]
MARAHPALKTPLTTPFPSATHAPEPTWLRQFSQAFLFFHSISPSTFSCHLWGGAVAGPLCRTAVSHDVLWLPAPANGCTHRCTAYLFDWFPRLTNAALLPATCSAAQAACERSTPLTPDQPWPS